VFTLEEKRVLVVNFQGSFYAVEDRCSHLGYSLYLGNVEGKVITCGFHYAKFDITTGEVLAPPAEKPLKTFQVAVKNSDIWVEL
jgi:3-phenylpropionate/trans-cinnamate dioxygenase ferredoxin subunit